MGFSTGSKLKVWEIVRTADKYTDIKASHSKKAKGGAYENDWSGFARLIGEAHTSGVKAGDTITVGGCDVTSVYSKEKKATYTNYLIFTLGDATPTPGGKPGYTAMEHDDDLPF